MLGTSIYINGLGSISAQGHQLGLLLSGLSPLQTKQAMVQEPNYAEFIEPNNIRRMGKLMKASMVAAKLCIADAGQAPDAIITGTGLGCMEETVKFLNAVSDGEGGVLSPTPFIHSTHNTIGSQIAIAVKCTGYNSTYVHRALSFEQALADAQLQLATAGSPTNILVGGVDDMVSVVFDVFDALGLMKHKAIDLIPDGVENHSIAGEGMNFVMLSNTHSVNTYAKLVGVKTLYKPTSVGEVQKAMLRFLADNDTRLEDIDLVMAGDKGNVSAKSGYKEILSVFEKESAVGSYKSLCGEYFTAAAFGMVLSALMLKNQSVPSVVCPAYEAGKPLRKVLCYQHFQSTHHSFFLLERV